MEHHLAPRLATAAATVVLLFAALAVPVAFAGSSPTIISDLPDYGPGATVTLTGTGWDPGESVHLLVNDDVGQTWSHTADVTADDQGSLGDTFQLPDWFIATYFVTATGATSGTATTTFTDATYTVSGTNPVVVGSTWTYTGARTGCTPTAFHWSVAGQGGNPASASIVGSSTVNPVTLNFTSAGTGGGGTVRLTFTVDTPATGSCAGGGNLDITVNLHATSLTQTLTPNPLIYGQTTVASGTLTDTTTSTGIGPGASVDVSAHSTQNGSCGGSSSSVGSDTTDASGNWGGVNYRPPSAGNRDVQASFSADATHAAATDCDALVVNKAGTEFLNESLTNPNITTAGSTQVDYELRSRYGINPNTTAGNLSIVKTSGSGILSCSATKTNLNTAVPAVVQGDGDGVGPLDEGFDFVVNALSYTDFRFTCSANVADTYTFHVHYNGDSNYSASDSASLTLFVTSGDTTAPSNVSIAIDGGAAWIDTTAATLHIHGEDNVGVTGYFVADGGTATCLAASFASYTAISSTTSYDDAALAHTLTSGDGTKTVCVVFRDAIGNKTAAEDTIGLDTVAPVITKTIPGTPKYNDGTNDFVTSSTGLRVNVVEAGSGLASCTISIDGPASNDTSFSCSTGDNDFTLGGQLSSPPDGTYVISVDATDNASNPASDPLTVILDNTGPDNFAETLGSPSYDDGTNIWVTSSTNISISGDDGSGSGVASCTKAFDGGATSAYTLTDNFNMPTPDGSHSYAIDCLDHLGNASSTFSKTRFVDDTGPVVTVTGVTNGATYILGSVPVAGCSTSDGSGSGVATNASLTGPSGLSQNGVGTASGSCGGATDNLGNPQSPDPLTFTFHVIYDPAGISGILQPINPDNTSVFKRGQAIPVKFSLSGDEFFGFVTTGWTIQRQLVPCSVFDGTDQLLESVGSNTPSQYFRYDASADQYIYNADMHNLGVGTCWNFKVTLDSGQVLYSAVFKLTK
jgi:hypothetical protein